MKTETIMNILMPSMAGASGSRRVLMAGVVKVNGEVVTDPNHPVFVTDRVTVGKHRVIQ